VLHGGELPRVALDVVDDRTEELGKAARGGIELDRHGAARVDLRIGGRRGGLAERVDAPGRADRVVERHQRVAEAEHRQRDDREPGEEPAVSPLQAHRLSSQYFAMMPTKNASAIEARMSAVRRFLLI